MGVPEVPGTVVLCCSLPADGDDRDLAARIDAASSAGVPMTWLVAGGRLPAAAERCARSGQRHGFAMEVPGGCQPTRLRQLLASVRGIAGDLDAVVVRETEPAGLYRVLADSGVRVVFRDAEFMPSRSGRRPAPRGWRCHSPAWGLWEVARTERPLPPNGWLPTWAVADAYRAGGLVTVDVGRDMPRDRTAGPIRGRIDRWKAWAGWRSTAPRARFAVLSDVPALVAAATGLPSAGSVLRAA